MIVFNGARFCEKKLFKFIINYMHKIDIFFYYSIQSYRFLPILHISHTVLNNIQLAFLNSLNFWDNNSAIAIVSYTEHALQNEVTRSLNILQILILQAYSARVLNTP